MAISGSTTTQNAAREARDAYSTLRDDIADVTDKVTKAAGERVGDAVTDARELASAKLNDLSEVVRRNPMQATLAALGAGLLFGFILRR